MFTSLKWRLSQLLHGVAVCAITACAGSALAASVPVLSLADAAKKLSSGGYVLMVRHGETDGGPQDPANARLGDCATQLKLSSAGKDWARKLGEAFKSAGIRVDDVANSAWCRARETAQLAFGKSKDNSSLNVFLAQLKRADVQQTTELKKALGEVKAPRNVVWVSHQVNITALSGFVPPATEVLVVRSVAGKVVAEFRFKPVP